MAHIALLYTSPHHSFAEQLATHLGQRGLVVWPVPSTHAVPPPVPADLGINKDASHVLVIGPLAPEATGALLAEWEDLLKTAQHVILIRCENCAELGGAFKKYPQVDFRDQYLLAIEDLVSRLEKTGAPTRPLTVEHPPPLTKPTLLPQHMPAERCWREDRLRINYNLPIILTPDELEVRLPAFLVKAGFELERSTPKQVRGRRLSKRYHWFDPRRAQHTLTIRRRKGRLRVYYRMTRMQVYHWFPAHYRVLDRESAALYRYLVTGRLDGVLNPVDAQARRAQVVSWGALVAFWVVVALVIVLIAR